MDPSKFKWTAKYSFIDRLKFWQFIVFFSASHSAISISFFLLGLKFFGLDDLGARFKTIVISMLIIYSLFWSISWWNSKANKPQ